LPDGSCDLVVCRHLVWTLPNPAGALLQWQRVLDAGGRIAVFESHQTAPKILQGYDSIYEQLPFYGGRPAEQLEAFFQQQGLRDVAVEPLMESIL
jgi:ubiquinone/menaquinone biosynthesis C-methylase UbiE